MQSFNSWFFSQFAPQLPEAEEPEAEKKAKRRKQKYINRKKRAQAQFKVRK